MDSFHTPARQQQFELEIKRSRFITTVACVNGKDQAKEFIQTVRDAFPDANHHCWAMIAGQPDDIYSQDQNDDGEPKGTAGRPMLNVLQHSQLGNIAVVVTRYFGGIKLGAGGLVRAYTQSVSQALQELATVESFITQIWTVKVPYALLGSLEHHLGGSSVQIGNKVFDELITMELLVPESATDELDSLLKELGGGSIAVQRDH